MNAIRIEGLKKYYGSVYALDGLNLTVETGTVYGFLGPNGAGKTTTIRLLTGLAHPTSGRAWVAGIEITADRREVARRIGHLPEEPAFYPWMTPLEFLDHVARIFGLTGQERTARVKELLERVGLAEVSRRRIGGFSRGMRQRLGLAQALVNRPDVLLLDEAVSALDPIGRKDVLELISQLRGECTIFMSTHILADVERVCDSVGIIAKGHMLIEAKQEDLLARYAVPAFEVESINGHAERLEDWTKTLQTLDWVKSVTVNGQTARIIVNDIEIAQSELMASAVQAELVLTRYEMVKPSLEDIFVQLVGQGGES